MIVLQYIFYRGFLNQTDGDLYATFQNKKVTSENRKGSALISVDACLNPVMQSNLDGSSFFYRVWTLKES